VVIVKPGGTGSPSLVISARLAPLPPSRSTWLRSPSAKSNTQGVPVPRGRGGAGAARRPVAVGPLTVLMGVPSSAPSARAADRASPQRGSRFRSPTEAKVRTPPLPPCGILRRISSSGRGPAHPVPGPRKAPPRVVRAVRRRPRARPGARSPDGTGGRWSPALRRPVAHLGGVGVAVGPRAHGRPWNGSPVSCRVWPAPGRRARRPATSAARRSQRRSKASRCPPSRRASCGPVGGVSPVPGRSGRTSPERSASRRPRERCSSARPAPRTSTARGRGPTWATAGSGRCAAAGRISTGPGRALPERRRDPPTPGPARWP
jgi:hypothetical protein